MFTQLLVKEKKNPLLPISFVFDVKLASKFDRGILAILLLMENDQVIRLQMETFLQFF